MICLPHTLRAIAHMQFGFSTHQGPGVGLPGAQGLMEDFGIESKPGKGTVVTMKKWLPA